MAIEFCFQINPDRICVQDLSTGYRLETNNRVVYRRRDEQILALGEDDKEARTQLGEFYEREADEICSATLFGADGAELPYEIRAMENFTRLLHRQSQSARPTIHFFAKLVDGFNYSMTIPNYENFSKSRRSALEQNLQGHLRLRRLVVNEREVQIPLWRRNLEFYLRRMLILVIPLVAMVAVYLNLPTAFTSNPILFLACLLLPVYCFYYLGKIVWMLLARWLVPVDYRLCMLLGRRSTFSRVDHFLVRVLWDAQTKIGTIS
jgi:hypothetical protein